MMSVEEREPPGWPLFAAATISTTSKRSPRAIFFRYSITSVGNGGPLAIMSLSSGSVWFITEQSPTDAVWLHYRWNGAGSSNVFAFAMDVLGHLWISRLRWGDEM